MPVSIVEKFLARVLHVLLVNGHIMYNFVINLEVEIMKKLKTTTQMHEQMVENYEKLGK